MTTVPGYRVSIELFLPADPEQPRQMAQSAAQLDSLAEQLERIGLPGATVSFRFVSRHRLPPSPPQIPGEPTQPLDNAPAETAEAGATTDTSGPSAMEAPHSGRRPAASPEPVAGKAAPDQPDGQPAVADCSHRNQKRYGGGAVVCLDCQATLAGAVA